MDSLQIESFCPLFLLIFGTIGNVFVVIACWSIKEPAFIFIRFMACTDITALYFWNLNHFLTFMFNLDLQNYSYFSCKFGDWVQFSSLQYSAWILVIFIFVKSNYVLEHEPFNPNLKRLWINDVNIN